jgi:CubicO group peptidase (beta-lactamase class C family)
MITSRKILLAILFVFSLFMSYAQKPSRPTTYTYTIPQTLNDGIETTSLEKIGMDSTRIIKLTQLILADSFPNIHSILIVKNNKLVYENYFAGKDQIRGKNLGYVEHSLEGLHDCRSVSKSVVSACVGIAVKQGLIKSIDDPIFNYFPDYQEYSDSLKAKITLRHLLTMSSGFEWDETGSYTSLRNSEIHIYLSLNPIKYILKRSVVVEPGTLWNYNGGETQILAEIVKIVSGLPIDKFADKYIFQPLNIKKYEWLPLIIKKIPAAASGLRLTSRDFLKFGQLYMNNGKWENEQILDSTWVVQTLTTSIKRTNLKANISKGGYGYQFWTYTEKLKDTNIDIVEAKGNGGQAIFLCKSLDLMVVITAGNYNQRGIVNNSHEALVKYIIPAMR